MRQYEIIPGPGRAVLLEVPPDEVLHLPGGGHLYLPAAQDHQAITCRVTREAEPYEDDLGRPLTSRYKLGALVVIGRFTGTQLTIDRTTYRIVRESDVIAELAVAETTDAEKEQGT